MKKIGSNVQTQVTDVKNIQTQVFIPRLRQHNKHLWGQQLITTSRFGLLTKGAVLYRQASQTKSIDDHVDLFIANSSQQRVRLSQFKRNLQQRIVQGKQSVNQFTLNEIADYLPWVFSSQMLFEPFRSILYAVKFKRTITTGTLLAIQKNVSNQTLNQAALQAIYESIKYKNSYITQARSLYASDYLGSLTTYLADDNKVDKLKTLLNTTIGIYQQGKAAIASFVQTLTRWKDGDNSKEPVYRSQLKNSVLDIVDQIFAGLRVYGTILINFTYLRKMGISRKINNIIYYYSLNQPSILISCQNSYATVYTINNGVLQQIPQVLFNIDFLRRIVSLDVVKLGGQLLNNLNTLPLETKYQKQSREQFKKKYLKWQKQARVKGVYSTGAKDQQFNKIYKGLI